MPLLAAVNPSPLVPNAPVSVVALVFDEEFTGTTLNTNIWNADWNGETLNEVTCSPANISVANSICTLTLSSTTVGAAINSNPAWVTPGFAFTDGYYAEARVNFPGSGANMYDWNAWWTSGQNWPTSGEIDIAECIETYMTSNYHYGTTGDQQQFGSNWPINGNDYAATFHTYGVARLAGTNNIYYDGVLVYSYSSSDNGGANFLIVNTGVGEGGTTVVGSTVQVDYIRVWELASSSGPQPTPNVSVGALIFDDEFDGVPKSRRLASKLSPKPRSKPKKTMMKMTTTTMMSLITM